MLRRADPKWTRGIGGAAALASLTLPLPSSYHRQQMPDHGAKAVLSPEEEELLLKQGELAALEAQVAAAEQELTGLREGLKAFDGEYLRVVAPCLAAMDEIRADAAEARAHQQEEGGAAESCSTAAHQGAYCPPEEMKSLFREVAKSIHPDLASSEAERRLRDEMMAHANAAYASGNQERLRKLLLDWKADPEAVQGDDVAARLIRVIRKIARARNRIQEIRGELKELRRSDVYFLKQRAERAAAEGRDLLAEMRRDLERQVEQQRARVAEMQRGVFAKMDG